MEKGRLTQRQNEAYEFIRGYVDRNRKPPTLQEIGDALGISSTNGVYKLLRALERKGYIEREKHAARGIRLLDEDEDPFGFDGGPPSLPVVSRTPSDEPGRLRERPQGTLSVDARLLRRAEDPDACLIGRAGDDGMNGAGIHKGDLLIVEEGPWEGLDNGTLTAVLVRDRLLPRELHFANNRLHLRPADRHYTEETFSPRDPGCHVIGRILGIIRML
jgi:repressor LexA